MTDEGQRNDSRDRSEHTAYRVRLPGFIGTEQIGLGDLVKRVTAYAGIKPCSACERRAAALNRRVVFTGPAR